MSGSRPRGGPRTFTATLRCGIVLTYESFTFLPDLAEVVPCRSHGYCSVASRDRPDARDHDARGRNSQRRSQEELLEFLSRWPVVSVHALKRHRFSLRTVAAAERDGLVEVDLVMGHIALRCAR